MKCTRFTPLLYAALALALAPAAASASPFHAFDPWGEAWLTTRALSMQLTSRDVTPALGAAVVTRIDQMAGGRTGAIMPARGPVSASPEAGADTALAIIAFLGQLSAMDPLDRLRIVLIMDFMLPADGGPGLDAAWPGLAARAAPTQTTIQTPAQTPAQTTARSTAQTLARPTAAAAGRFQAPPALPAPRAPPFVGGLLPVLGETTPTPFFTDGRIPDRSTPVTIAPPAPTPPRPIPDAVKPPGTTDPALSGTPAPVTPIPLPAGIWALLLGLFALGSLPLLSRRSQSA